MSANDPKQTCAAHDCCCAKLTIAPHFAGRNFCSDGLSLKFIIGVVSGLGRQCNGGISFEGWSGQRWRGRLRRARSSPQSCQQSGFLARTSLQHRGTGLPHLHSGCAELGWTEGRNVAIEPRWAEDAASATPRSPPSSSGSRSTLLSHNTPPHPAAKQAASVIPIVFASAGDPVGTGLVAKSVATRRQCHRLVGQTADLGGKRLGLFARGDPGLRRLAILANVNNPLVVLDMHEVQEAARTLGLEVMHSKSDAPRISRPPSRRSRAELTQCTWLEQTRS